MYKNGWIKNAKKRNEKINFLIYQKTKVQKVGIPKNERVEKSQLTI